MSLTKNVGNIKNPLSNVHYLFELCRYASGITEMVKVIIHTYLVSSSPSMPMTFASNLNHSMLMSQDWKGTVKDLLNR